MTNSNPGLAPLRYVRGVALQERRQKIAAMYLQRKTLRVIAHELGLSYAAVSKDLRILRQQWQDSALTDFNERMAQEVAKIDNLEVTYWQAWEKSLEEKSTTLSEQNVRHVGDTEQSKRNKEQVRRMVQQGNPAFLEGVRWCIEKRCQIFGLNAPQVNVHIPVSELSEDELYKIIEGE